MDRLQQKQFLWQEDSASLNFLMLRAIDQGHLYDTPLLNKKNLSKHQNYLLYNPLNSHSISLKVFLISFTLGYPPTSLSLSIIFPLLPNASSTIRLSCSSLSQGLAPTFFCM